ncbi:MAG: sensor histidine kinase [Gemmatimonadota bacterium]
MRPDENRRRVIPLHGGADADVESDFFSTSGTWRPERLVHEAPAGVRPLIVDLLGAMGCPQEQVAELRRTLPEPESPDYAPEQMSAAVALVRAAVHRDAEEAGAEVTRRRHDCLDAAAVAWAQATLDRRETLHRRFLRDVSHDIRSPLNSILFLADALRSRHSGELNDVQGRQVDVLFMASVTLVKLVNDLIDYAHLDAEAELQVALTPFSPGAVIEEVRSLVGPLLEYHEVALTVAHEAASPRRGDAQLLNRVLLNLVTNAVQAMPDGGTVSLVASDGPDEELVISVKDEALDADHAAIRAALADAARGAVLAETHGWTHGLGLSISARLAAAAAGSIEVETVEPHGTRFVLRLPFFPL